MKIKSGNRDGSTLVVTIIVVSTLLVLLGVAVDYSTQISRNTQRTRKSAVAMEIADGHLETLFTHWRNIYRSTWTTTAWAQSGGTDYSLVGTNFFNTNCPSCSPTPAGVAPTPITQMSPSPGSTPPKIPLPDRSLFPTEPGYTVTQYRIQAVDPMITLNSSENAMIEGDSTKKGTGGWITMAANTIPPAAYGPNKAFGLEGGFPYSLFYLAAVDVAVPTQKGSVTTKMRRVFEKKFDLPWAYALFYIDDLELQPSTPMTVTGPIHTNATLYIGTSNFTAANPTYASPTPFPTSGRVEYGADYVNGYSPKDPRYPGSSHTAPNFAKSNASLALSDCPPVQVSPFLPFGWNLKFDGVTGSTNDDSYHEIIERPVSTPDPLSNVRYYSQPSYRVTINTDGSASITRIDSAGTVTNITGSTYNNLIGNSGQGNSTTVFEQGKALIDAREVGVTMSNGATNGAVKVTNVDIAKLVTNIGSLSNWTGILHLADAGAGTFKADRTVKTAGTVANVVVNGVTYPTTRRAFRLINAHALPTSGLTIVSENPVYIQGNFNTCVNSGDSVPSNNNTFSDPDSNSPNYARKPAAIIADSITVLSKLWNDANSASGSSTGRVASANVTINAALVAGNVPSDTVAYSGGGENFIRLLEDWSGRTICYYGSMIQMFQSNQAIGRWTSGASLSKAPDTTKWYHDYATFADGNPPGNLQIAAYLQQQRWYQVY